MLNIFFVVWPCISSIYMCTLSTLSDPSYLERLCNGFTPGLRIFQGLRNSRFLYLSSRSPVINLFNSRGQGRFYSSSAELHLTGQSLIKLDPWFVTGFTDGEGSFSISITPNNTSKVGYSVKIFFLINLHSKDLILLKSIESFFGLGSIYIRPGNVVTYMVQSKDELEIIIKHFDKYPLISSKFADFLLFKQAFRVFKNKEHLTPAGLKNIVAIKASANLGLSEKIQGAFPNVVPVDRPKVLDHVIKDPNWIAGFSSAEGSFYISLIKSKTLSTGTQVLLTFSITQHSRDVELMKNIISYFECGRYSTRKNKLAGDIEITKFSDLSSKILPFFSKYPIEGVKSQDLFDFSSAAELIKNKAHLTKEGLEAIRQIKEGMNRSR